MNANLKAAVTRRNFLHSSLAATATLPIINASTLVSQNVNNLIRIGLIGCGGRGGKLLPLFSGSDGVEITGLCDPDQKRLDNAGKQFTRAKKWTYMREMLDSKEINAVVLQSLARHSGDLGNGGGKACLCRKTAKLLTQGRRTGCESREKYGRICQLGTQQRSNPIQAEIKNFLHEEKVSEKSNGYE